MSLFITLAQFFLLCTAVFIGGALVVWGLFQWSQWLKRRPCKCKFCHYTGPCGWQHPGGNAPRDVRKQGTAPMGTGAIGDHLRGNAS